MRHLGKIACDRRAGNVPSKGDHEQILGGTHFFGFQNFTERNRGHLFVRHFHANQGFSGNRGFNTDRLDFHIHGDVGAKVRNLGNLDAGSQLQFKTGNGGAVGDVAHLCIDAEAGQRFLKPARPYGILFRGNAGHGGRPLEKINAGKYIGRFLNDGCSGFLAIAEQCILSGITDFQVRLPETAARIGRQLDFVGMPAAGCIIRLLLTAPGIQRLEQSAVIVREYGFFLGFGMLLDFLFHLACPGRRPALPALGFCGLLLRLLVCHAFGSRREGNSMFRSKDGFIRHIAL